MILKDPRVLTATLKFMFTDSEHRQMFDQSKYNFVFLEPQVNFAGAASLFWTSKPVKLRLEKRRMHLKTDQKVCCFPMG